jgi:hypothetical protein
MPYSRSRRTLESRLPELEQLKNLTESSPVAWESLDNKPDRFAFKLREAMQLALRYPHVAPWLTYIAARVRFRVQDNIIIAELVSEPVREAPTPTSSRDRRVKPSAVRPIQAPARRQPVVEHPIFTKDSSPALARKFTADSIIGDWLHSGKPRHSRIAGVDLTREERRKLFGQLSKLSMHFFYNEDEHVLVMESGKPEDNEGCWTPELQAELDRANEAPAGPSFKQILG